jgi:uncharacterized membrane protein
MQDSLTNAPTESLKTEQSESPEQSLQGGRQAAFVKFPRLHILDMLRGAAIIYMVFYHALYTMHIFGLEFAMGIIVSQNAFIVDFLAALFIFLAGMSCNFSKNNAKHGASLLTAAYLVTAASLFVLPKEAITFGILHLLSASMLVYAAFERVLRKIPVWVGACLCLLIFVLTYGVSSGYLGFANVLNLPLPEILKYQNKLYMFGFIDASYAAADYFPIFPHMFMFLAGSFIGRTVVNNRDRLPVWTTSNYIPPLSFIGRHSLVIYLLHQPVLFAVMYLLQAAGLV